ncbi:uncharacterized protein EKO05_0005840 [Ascochyta rabiei]|uniref:uncharacterized protein n=1 Tax=Didymella rabiei TaxID=5454 RepID=UPI0021FD92A1|nr:uncharacterized protein EKO05_0005840 [Ascochyta rabiei]UPX15393.1 hypothetical protein EKO05_0005840 [Ascochyta rabiei]
MYVSLRSASGVVVANECWTVDYLLKRPKGHPLKPREELREVILVETTPGVDASTVVVEDGEASAAAVSDTIMGEDDVVAGGISRPQELSRDFGWRFSTDYEYLDAPYQRNSEAAFSSLDGISEQPAEYDGDVEDGEHTAQRL